MAAVNSLYEFHVLTNECSLIFFLISNVSFPPIDCHTETVVDTADVPLQPGAESCLSRFPLSVHRCGSGTVSAEITDMTTAVSDVLTR